MTTTATMQRTHLSLSRRQRTKQQGVALFVVIVFVMLSMLLALWASRTSLFNEMVVGNDADYQRAFEAAQALLQDAEFDIRGQRPDGEPCTETSGAECRDNLASAYKIPVNPNDVTPLLADLGTHATKCFSGLCSKRTGRQDFWSYTDATSPAPTNIKPGEVMLKDMTKSTVGARYGQYTGAIVGNPSSPTTTANPILADKSADNSGGWYWIEILPYDESSKNSGLIVETAPSTPSTTTLLALNLRPNVAYRITALAYGRKPSTMVVLQQSYVQQVQKD